MPDDVVIYASDDEIEGHLYRAMLEEAGIPVNMKITPDMWGQRTVFAGPHQARVMLLVPAAEERHATELVQSFREEAESGRLAEELEEPDGECAHDNFMEYDRADRRHHRFSRLAGH